VSIEKNVENKIEIANTLNRRIETFVTFVLFSQMNFTKDSEKMKLFIKAFVKITIPF